MNEKLEKIAELVHNAWWNEKIKQGVTDHPDMIPYAELDENVKEYDRVTARAVMEALPELQGWSKAKERMPKEYENELSDGTRVMGSGLVQVTVMDLNTDKIFVAYDCTFDGKWCTYEETTGMFEVMAWQPMAEPYCPTDEPD